MSTRPVVPVFKVGDADTGMDSLEAYSRGGQITIEIEEPWAVSTETGFGQTCSLSLSATDALALAEWLNFSAHQIIVNAEGR